MQCILMATSNSSSKRLLIVLWAMFTILSCCLCLLFIFTITRFLHKVWWTPIRIQNFMASQGIKGPSYRFLHGNTKEIMNMKKKSMSTPMDLLRHDHVYPRVLPQIYSWTNIYGNNFEPCFKNNISIYLFNWST